MLGKQHIAYLRMLGVKRLILMYDNEEPKKENQKEGAGNVSMRIQVASIKEVIHEVCEKICPRTDPSACLESMHSAKQLRDMILSEF